MKKILIDSALVILAFFAPAQNLFIATGILIIADLIMGIYAAYKTGDPITSAGITRTVGKFLVYNTCIGSGFLVQHYLMADAIPVSNIISSIIGLAELKSIIENADRISNGSVMKAILAKLGSVNDDLNKKS